MKARIVPITKLVLIGIATYSFINILTEWNMSQHLNTVLAGSYFTLVVITAILNLICILFTFTLTKACQNVSFVSEKAIPYQFYMAIVYARSCHVWTHTIQKQLIIKACGEILTLGAPTSINWTCVEQCDGGVPQEHHNLPFISSDATFQNATPACNPWFTDDQTSLVWTTSWETVIFVTFCSNCILNIFKKKLQLLDIIDIASLLATSSIAFVPKAYYSIYNLGGVLRFLGLGHAIVPLEHKIKTKQLVGFILVLKLAFVALMGTAIMFVAEKPCRALQQDCDTGFDNFGDTLYFIFVTLSTVGFGDMSPKTEMGKVAIVFIIMASISYLPNLISDVIEMCKINPIHHRLEEMHEDIRQVGFFMHGGTHKKKKKKKNRLLDRLQKRTYHKEYKDAVELKSLIPAL